MTLAVNAPGITNQSSDGGSSGEREGGENESENSVRDLPWRHPLYVHCVMNGTERNVGLW